MMMSASYIWNNTLNWIFIVLAHCHGSLQGRHVTPLIYITLNPSLPVLPQTHKCCMLSREVHVVNTNFISRSWRGVLNTTLCYKVCQWLATDQWYSQCTLVSSTNKTDRHDIYIYNIVESHIKHHKLTNFIVWGLNQ